MQAQRKRMIRENLSCTHIAIIMIEYIGAENAYGFAPLIIILLNPNNGLRAV